MKKFTLLLLVLLSLSSWAQLTQRPKLTDSVMVENAGGVISLLAVLDGKKTMLMAIDVGSPKAALWLDQLKSTKGVIARGNAIVLLAFLPQQQEQAEKLIESSPGVRFVKDPGLVAMRALKLPGLPAMMGVSNDGTITWQQMGDLPGTRSVVDVIDSWIKSAPPTL
jgi:hypothetical protein